MGTPAERKGSLRRSGGAKQLGRPPGATAEDTVKRVVDAAQEQFGMHGYSGARMTEIASAAGITHSSVYQYFASKKELYQAAFQAALGELLPEYLEATVTQESLRDRLAGIMRASARAHHRSPAITPFLASLPVELRRHPDLVPSLELLGGDLMTSLSTMFADARRNDEIAPEITDRDLLVGFIGSAMGIGLLSYALPDGDMAAAVEVVVAGLNGTLFRR